VGPPLDAEAPTPAVEGGARGKYYQRDGGSGRERKARSLVVGWGEIKQVFFWFFSPSVRKKKTHLALKRVVPMLNTLAASDSVRRATDASVTLFITCKRE
jgi:hypothetical protein